MKAAVFYGVATVVSLGAIAAEAAWARRKGKRWYDAKDTLGNLNIGAGNVLTGIVLAAVVAAGYAGLFAHRFVDSSARLPGWAAFALAVVFADFLQYWNHRLSHSMSLLWAGHITHHSSTHLNLSTGIRINWLYRGYAWVLYAPMPLLGFSFESFVFAQAIIGTYNLLMHTRLEVPFGPLRKVLVTPASHGLHHSSDPRYFGNYGAALIVWDRLFGTYRELPAGAESEAQTFGIGRSMGANALRLNFHYVTELWDTAREHRLSFARLLFTSADAVPAGRAAALGGVERHGSMPITPALWLALAAVAAVTMAAQAAAQRGLGTVAIAEIIVGLALVTAFGIALDGSRGDHVRPSMSDPGGVPAHAQADQAPPNHARRRWLVRSGTVVIASAALVFAAYSLGVFSTPVLLAPVVRGKAIEAVYATGAVEAEDRVVLRSKAPGTVELLAREGAAVRRGDLLARIVNPGLQYDLERGRADLHAAAVMAQDDSPPLHMLEAQARAVQSELTLGRQELERVEALLRSNALPQAELDRARGRVAQLEATLAANASQQRTMKLDLSANVARQGAQVKSLASHVADVEVRSPSDGVVLKKMVANGETIAANQPILRIGDLNHLVLEVNVDEADVMRVSDGSRSLPPSAAAVRLYAFPKQTFHGTVIEVLPDANRERRAFVTKVRVVDAPEGMRSGMTAEVNIIAAQNDSALLVPASAERSGSVWVAEGGRARSRSVTVGIRDLANVEIRSGLAEGEIIVVDPAPQLREGARVRGEVRAPGRSTSLDGPAQASLR